MVVAWKKTTKAHIAQSRFTSLGWGVTFHVASCGISNWVLLNVIQKATDLFRLRPFHFTHTHTQTYFFAKCVYICVCCSAIFKYWSSGVEQPDDKVFDERNTICIEQIVMKYKSNSFGKSNVYTHLANWSFPQENRKKMVAVICLLGISSMEKWRCSLVCPDVMPV